MKIMVAWSFQSFLKIAAVIIAATLLKFILVSLCLFIPCPHPSGVLQSAIWPQIEHDSCQIWSVLHKVMFVLCSVTAQARRVESADLTGLCLSQDCSRNLRFWVNGPNCWHVGWVSAAEFCWLFLRSFSSEQLLKSSLKYLRGIAGP